MITVQRSVESGHPVSLVARYLCDFTSTAQWDPHTVKCVQVGDGPVAAGTEYDNTQRIGPARTTLRYRVTDFDPGRSITLRSSSSWALDSTDQMTFDDRGPDGTRVTYTATLRLKGIAALGEPILRRAMPKIADDAAVSLRSALAALPASS